MFSEVIVILRILNTRKKASGNTSFRRYKIDRFFIVISLPSIHTFILSFPLPLGQFKAKLWNEQHTDFCDRFTKLIRNLIRCRVCQFLFRLCFRFRLNATEHHGLHSSIILCKRKFLLFFSSVSVVAILLIWICLNFTFGWFGIIEPNVG